MKKYIVPIIALALIGIGFMLQSTPVLATDTAPPATEPLFLYQKANGKAVWLATRGLNRFVPRTAI